MPKLFAEPACEREDQRQQGVTDHLAATPPALPDPQTWRGPRLLKNERFGGARGPGQFYRGATVLDFDSDRIRRSMAYGAAVPQHPRTAPTIGDRHRRTELEWPLATRRAADPHLKW